MTAILSLLVAAGLAFLFLRGLRDHWTAARARKARRAGYFASLSPEAMRPTPSGFARASLTRDGARFDLQALTDALSFRKLPCLWLMVTLPRPQPLGGETRLMARASGLETFSTFAEMPHEIALPPGFPPNVTLRCTDPSAVPGALIPRLAPLFADPGLKEITLSPKGLRLVHLAEEAPRNAYLLFRDAELPQAPLDPARVETMARDLLSLEKALA